MTDLDGSAEIVATHHAVRRARERLGWEGDHDDLAALVVRDVRVAILCGREALSRPNWTHQGLRPRPNTDPAQRYVWDEAASRCWVLRVQARGRVVVTTMYASRELEQAERDGRRYL